MRRRRSIPWIHRHARQLIGAIAVLGLLETAFLTAVEFAGKAADVCPTTGCKLVLESDYAKIFGLPITLFGFLAYSSIAILALAPRFINSETKLELRSKLEDTSWLLMFAIATAMVVFSSNLMYVMLFKIQALCPYCLASALFSVTLFVLTIIGRDWEDVGQLIFTGILVGMVTLIGAVGVYANVGTPVATEGTQATLSPSGPPKPGVGWTIRNTSGSAEIALARHLKKIGAKEYGAFWCPHCHEQKELFGKEAFSDLDFIECDPQGKNARPELCKAAIIKSFPTWEINGKKYEGVQSLQELADLSGYSGARDFKRSFPSR